MLGKSFEYHSESLHIIYVVVCHDDRDACHGWNVLILYSNPAKSLGWAYDVGDLMWVSSEGMAHAHTREIGSVPTSDMR